MQYLITRQLVDEQEQMTDKLPALQQCHFNAFPGVRFHVIGATVPL